MMNHIIFNGYLLISQFLPNLSKKDIEHINFFQNCNVITFTKECVTITNKNLEFKLDPQICRKIFRYNLLFKIISKEASEKILDSVKKQENTTVNLDNFAFAVNDKEFLIVN